MTIWARPRQSQRHDILERVAKKNCNAPGLEHHLEDHVEGDETAETCDGPGLRHHLEDHVEDEDKAENLQ